MSDIVQSKEAVESTKVFMKKMAALTSKKRVDSRTVPTGLVSMQTFPVNIAHFLRNLENDATLLERCRHIPPPE